MLVNVYSIPTDKFHLTGLVHSRQTRGYAEDDLLYSNKLLPLVGGAIRQGRGVTYIAVPIDLDFDATLLERYASHIYGPIGKMEIGRATLYPITTGGPSLLFNYKYAVLLTIQLPPLDKLDELVNALESIMEFNQARKWESYYNHYYYNENISFEENIERIKRCL